MKRWLYPILAIILLMSAVGISGCNGTGVQGGVFLEMLKLIPDFPEIREYVQITDYTRIREIWDIARPVADASEEVIQDYIIAVSYDPPDNPRHARASFLSGIADLYYPYRRYNIGFGPQDVDQDIVAGNVPNIFEAIRGSFDLAVIEDAISSYDEALMPEIGSYQGVTTYTWEDLPYYERQLAPPVYDEWGDGSSLAVQEEYVFRAYSPDRLVNMIDASQGSIPSLADDPDFRLTATALTEMGAHSAIITDSLLNEVGIFTDYLMSHHDIHDTETREEIVAEMQPLLNYYHNLAVGIGYDDEGLFITIVLIYDSPQQARADVDILEQRIEENTSLWLEAPWRDIVDSYEVWADGRSLRTILRGDIVADWLWIQYPADTLLVCENSPEE